MAKPRKRRRKLSMTSLIDVIFLLLLFFMLTSTFSKFSEVELSVGAAGGVETSDNPPLFLQVNTDDLRLNAEAISLLELSDSRIKTAPENTPLIVNIGARVTAQRLTDLLVVLRKFPNVNLTILGH